MTDTQPTNNWPEWMDPEESVVCNGIISAIFSHGYLIRVREEGGDVLLPSSTDRFAIQAATAQTAMTFYDVMAPFPGGSRVRLGTFILIHGNGEDVLHDYSWPKESAGSRQAMEAIDATITETLGLV